MQRPFVCPILGVLTTTQVCAKYQTAVDCCLLLACSWVSDYGWLWREVPVSIDYGIENALDSVSDAISNQSKINFNCNFNSVKSNQIKSN